MRRFYRLSTRALQFGVCVLGGFDGDKALRSVEKYEMRQWTRVASMVHRRSVYLSIENIIENSHRRTSTYSAEIVKNYCKTFGFCCSFQ